MTLLYVSPRPCVVALALLLSSTAEARRMPEYHYDLAGLVLQSEAIVTADRGAPGKSGTKYHVVKSVRGAIAAGTDLDLDDTGYDTAGVDARVTSTVGHVRIPDKPDKRPKPARTTQPCARTRVAVESVGEAELSDAVGQAAHPADAERG